MKTIITTMVSGLALLAASHASADIPHVENPYGGVHMLRGTVVSVGRVDPSVNVGTGFFVDANYSSVAINFGAASKKFGESPLRAKQDGDDDADAARRRVNNLYAGVGFGRIIQLQGGYGNKGQLLRFRSDFNFRSVVDFLTQTSTPKHRLTLADRITFTVSVERYNDDEEIFNNSTWGVGLLF